MLNNSWEITRIDYLYNIIIPICVFQYYLELTILLKWLRRALLCLFCQWACLAPFNFDFFFSLFPSPKNSLYVFQAHSIRWSFYSLQKKHCINHNNNKNNSKNICIYFINFRKMAKSCLSMSDSNTDKVREVFKRCLISWILFVYYLGGWSAGQWLTRIGEFFVRDWRFNSPKRKKIIDIRVIIKVEWIWKYELDWGQ